MEALVLIFAEAVGAALAPLVTLVGMALAGLLGIVVQACQVIWALVRRRLLRGPSRTERRAPTAVTPAGAEPGDRRMESEASDTATRPKRRRGAKILTAAVILLVAIAVTLRIAAKPLVDRALAGLEERDGTRITYQDLSIDVLTGRIQMSGVRVERDREDGLACALDVDDAEIDLHVPALLTGHRRLERVACLGVRGEIRYAADGEASPGRREGGSFVIDEVLLSDIDVAVALLRTGNDLEGRIHIGDWRTAPLRRRMALFDVLYRTNAEGEVFGAPFAITCSGDDSGLTTMWRAENLPLAALATTGQRPLTWLKSGSVDAEVEDQWRVDSPRAIHTDYRLHLRDAEVSLPSEAGPLERRLGAALAELLADRGGELVLAFEFDVDPDRMDGGMSQDADALSLAMFGALIDEVSNDNPALEAEYRALLGTTKAVGKRVLDAWRRGE